MVSLYSLASSDTFRHSNHTGSDLVQDTLRPMLHFKLEDRPPPLGAAFVGFQHLLAMFGGILTAPLLVALGMGLGPADTTYLISSALVISGFATLVQINRIGMLGAGLLSIQGTSFAFIGPLVFSYEKLVLNMSSDQALGVIFGSSAVCAAIMMALSLFVRHLKNIITTNVAGATIILLGLSLVHTTLLNLERAFYEAGGRSGEGFSYLLLAGLVFFVILILGNLRQAWLRLSSITIGLVVGVLASLQFGVADFSGLGDVPAFFLPELFRYPISVDLYVMALIMPIYLVSAMESIGDITATNNLSGLKAGDQSYWARIRGGIMAGGFNSLVAALFSTFPNTTFSQNNGVIRLTGVCSRYIGNYVAAFLILLGCVPVVAALFQAIPSVVIFGATLLMFMLVALSGFRVVELSNPRPRDWTVVALAIVSGYGLSAYADRITFFTEEVTMVLQFPVSTGAMLAILIEFLIPGRTGDADTSG